MKRWSWVVLLTLVGCTPWDDLVAARLCADGGLRPACERNAGDAGERDAGVEDAGTGDAGTEDAGTQDAGTGDAGTGDAGTGDAGTGDAGADDAGIGDAGADAGFDAGIDAGPEFSCESGDAGGQVDWYVGGESGFWDIKASRRGVFTLSDDFRLLPDGGGARVISHFSPAGIPLGDFRIPAVMAPPVMLRFDVDGSRVVVLEEPGVMPSVNGKSLHWFDGAHTVVPLSTNHTYQRVALHRDGVWLTASTGQGFSVIDVSGTTQRELVAQGSGEVIDLISDRQGRAVVVVRESQVGTRVMLVEHDAGVSTLNLDAGTAGGAAAASVLTSLSRPSGEWLCVIDEMSNVARLGQREPHQFVPIAELTTDNSGHPDVLLASCEGTNDLFAAVSFAGQLSLNGSVVAGDGGINQLLALRLRADGGVSWLRALSEGNVQLGSVALNCGRLFVSGRCAGDLDAGPCTSTPMPVSSPFLMSVKP